MVLEFYFKKQTKQKPQRSLEQKKTSRFLPSGRLLECMTGFAPLLELRARGHLTISSSVACHRRTRRLLLQGANGRQLQNLPCQSPHGSLVRRTAAGETNGTPVPWPVPPERLLGARLQVGCPEKSRRSRQTGHVAKRDDASVLSLLAGQERGSSGKQAGSLLLHKAGRQDGSRASL